MLSTNLVGYHNTLSNAWMQTAKVSKKTPLVEIVIQPKPDQSRNPLALASGIFLEMLVISYLEPVYSQDMQNAKMTKLSKLLLLLAGFVRVH